ncbi:MAG: methyltransferase domain-containing protein [Bryobacteraceae bacterium]
MPGAEISPMVEKAWEFGRILRAKKAALAPGFDWYPYDSMANAAHLDALCEGGLEALAATIRGQLVADIGCADGDFAFFLESLGARVHAFDHPKANHNSMRGVRAMKQALGSNVEIHRVDIDAGFTLPAERYKLIFFLGTLYHVRNPLRILETLAAHAELCILSTRVARRLPNGVDIEDSPVGYLLGADELNADDSNFWIFSPAGLRRLLERTYWKVGRWCSVGDTAASDPVSHRDERAYVLARSTFGAADVELLSGWHAPEGAGWRWTERRFSVRCPVPEDARTARLHVDFYLAPEFVEVRKSITVRCEPGPLETFDSPGAHRLTVNLLPLENDGEVVFTLDQWLAPEPGDGRERGIIVSAMKVEHG